MFKRLIYLRIFVFMICFSFFSCRNDKFSCQGKEESTFLLDAEEPSIYCADIKDSVFLDKKSGKYENTLLSCMSERLIDEPCFAEMISQGCLNYCRLGIYSGGVLNDTLVSFDLNDFCCVVQRKIVSPYRRAIGHYGEVHIRYFVEKSPVSCNVFHFIDSLFLSMKKVERVSWQHMQNITCYDCRTYGLQCCQNGKYKEVWLEEDVVPLKLRKRINKFLHGTK